VQPDAGVVDQNVDAPTDVSDPLRKVGRGAWCGEVGGDDVDNEVRVALEQGSRNCCSLSARRATSTRLTPRRANWPANSSPIPPLEPVINAVLLLRSTWRSYGSRGDQASR
jgi:hypothetical protein